MIKEEKSRIIKLVNLAYKNDPRVQFEEEKIRVAKEEIKAARLLQQQREKAEEEEKIRLKKAQNEENAKKQAEFLKEEKRTVIKNTLDLAALIGVNLSGDDAFQITINGKTDILKNLLNEVDSKESMSDKIRIYKNMCSSMLGVKFTEDKSNPKSEKESQIWTKEEVTALQKATKKFPAGMKNRWELVAELVKTKSQSQMIQMTHFLTTNPTIKFDADIDLSKMVNKGKMVVLKPQEPEKVEEKKESVTETPALIVDDEAWTDDQQKNLETALKKYPASMQANQRWTSIAKDVKGKTKKQCIDRYKYLSSLIRK